MVKLLCVICGYTLQESEPKHDIDDVTICGKCYKKWNTLVKYFINSDQNNMENNK